MTTTESVPAPSSALTEAAMLGSAPVTSGGPKTALSQRKNGKIWHTQKDPFRKNPGLTSYAARLKQRELAAATKKLEKEMKDEKAAQRESWIANIKDRREKKVERERYQKLEQKMHKKRVERLKRREKRNKLLGK